MPAVGLSDYTFRPGDRCCLDSIVRFELAEDVGNMDARRLPTDEQRLTDLPVGLPCGNELEDLTFRVS